MKKEQQSVSKHIGERLDFFLSNTPNVASRSQAQKIIAAGLVFVNQKKILLKDYKLQKKDTVCFSFLEPIQLESVKSPLEIHYEDESLLVVYKPAGLIVHPASSHQKISLVHYLLAHTKNSSLSSMGGDFRKGIVHRLDKDTSGLLVVAKNNLVHENLTQQFKAHSIIRKYLCFSLGNSIIKSGTIEKKIARHPKKRTIFCAVDKNESIGKTAKTDWKILQTFQTIHLLECKLHTGRTHQIRVHLSSIGMPLLGDKTYGKQKPSLLQNFDDTQKQMITNFPRQALHAAELGFQHPISKKELFFSRPLPQDMEDLLKCLKKI